MSDLIHHDILKELKAIRYAIEDLAARPTPAPAPASPRPTHPAPAGTAPGPGRDGPIPQPSRPWPLADAQAHQIHFGKNVGVNLDSLTENSLSFYAKDKPPQLNSKGTPFAKRPIDIDLEDAARTLWHARKGTLAGAGTPQAAPTAPKTDQTAPSFDSGDEEVPY